MKTLRRYDIPNSVYFITVITFDRKPLLTDNYELFHESWRSTKPLAWVVMPDHFHALFYLKESPISSLIHHFKTTFVRAWHKTGGSGRFWQNRFWDHVIRDSDDMKRHLDYIHYNPVKHGIAEDPFLYERSSLGKWYEKGYYQRDWGCIDKPKYSDEYGE